MGPAVAVITGDFNRAGIVAVAIITLKIRMFVLLHYRMTSVASGLLPVGLMALCAGLHFNMHRAAVCQFKVFFFMAGLAGVEGQVPCEFYRIVRTYAGFFWKMWIFMAPKAEFVLKLLFPMPCVAIHAPRYLEGCAMALLTALVFMWTIGYFEYPGSIERRCFPWLRMRPVAVRAGFDPGNIEMTKIQNMASGAVHSKGRKSGVQFYSCDFVKNTELYTLQNSAP